jgi:hypothetical protein
LAEELFGMAHDASDGGRGPTPLPPDANRAAA